MVASVAKDVQRQDLNEDAYALGEESFAVSDGASESYDSKSWARLLSNAYLLDQDVGESWLVNQVQSYLGATDFTSLSWSRQAAFERGSFATLLGLKLASDSTSVDLIAVGDSLAIHVRQGVILKSFPLEHAVEFDERPLLLSTLASANGFVRRSDFSANSTTSWSIQDGDQILLVTDAVAHWLLTDTEALTALSSIRSPDEFQEIVLKRRMNKTMKVDDSTVLRIVVDSAE